MVVAGLDFGTQSVKVLVYDSSKKEVLALTSHPFELISKDDGAREQKASWYIDGLKDCFSKIDKSIKERIEALAVSGQQHGFVPVAANGEVLANVKLWCDTSTARECDELTSLYGSKEELVRNVGNAILPGYTASKILAFKKRCSELYSRLAYVLLPHDYINYYLTGNIIMERGDASGTALYNIYENKWDEKLCSLIDKELIEKLPAVTDSKGIVGTVKADVCKELGLNDGVVVAAGGGDNMMSAIGTGTVENGSLTMSLGTSGTLFAYSDAPVTDVKCRLAGFASSSGGYLPLLCTMNCTVASENMRGLFSLDVKEFDKEAENAPIGAEGIVLLPFFNGERVPNFPKGEGVLAGMNMSNIKASNIARATLEGVSFEFLLGIEAFRESGFVASSLSLTGGGSKSAIWRQIIADLTGLEVRVPLVKEAAAFGAALQALAASEKKDLRLIAKEHIEFDNTKEAHPVSSRRCEYERAYRKWKSYMDTLGGLYE